MPRGLVAGPGSDERLDPTGCADQSLPDSQKIGSNKILLTARHIQQRIENGVGFASQLD